ncbi:MAG TPA: Sec-independent protein translocase protein TatB [Acetobacteraceae bacterium]|jgi:sec-independent protein translocase protein TatB
MFDFAWSEIALIAVVAMIAIGPKDMPAAMRTVSGWVKKARRMAGEFQSHVDEMMREADLSEVRASINEIRNFDIKGEIEKTIDADGSIRSTFASNPLEPSTPAVTSIEELAVSEPVIEALAPTEQAVVAATPCTPRAPAFVPPKLVLPVAIPAAGGSEPPAFIPPDVVRQRHARPSV